MWNYAYHEFYLAKRAEIRRGRKGKRSSYHFAPPRLGALARGIARKPPRSPLRVRSQPADGIAVLKDNTAGLADGLRYTFRIADKARPGPVDPSHIGGG